MSLPDLNNSKHIDDFINTFYDRIFKDDLLAPIFTEGAKIGEEKHLPIVSLFWQKILLGDKRYKNNTINIHRKLNLAHRFEEHHYQRWLKHFVETANTNYSGYNKDKAVRVAQNIIANMKNKFNSDNTYNMV